MSLAPNTPHLAAALSALALVGTASVANADLLSMRAEARAGFATGKGMFGEVKSEAFQEGRGLPSYGVIVGAELAFIDLWVEHNQYLDGGVDGTWTQFMLGFDVQIDMGGTKGETYDSAGRAHGGYDAWFTELGLGAGFGVGTGQQVDPPLDNSELTDKGFLIEARAMAGYRLTEMLQLGFTVPLSFGYFTKSGTEVFANDVDNHYAAFGLQGMFTLRADFQVK